MEIILTAFVLMPFEAEFDQIYEDLIKQPLTDVGYRVLRADSLLDQRSILREIVTGIATADLIVADLTTNNPNVFYELGLCHALQRPTILLAQSINDVPFDLRSYRIHIYDTHFSKIKRLKEFLKEIGKKHRDGRLSFGNPVTDFAVSDKKSLATHSSTALLANNEDSETGESLIGRYLTRLSIAFTNPNTVESLKSSEGKQFGIVMEQLVRLNRCHEAVASRLGGDGHLTNTLLEAFAGERGVLRTEGSTINKIFRDIDSVARIEGMLAKAGFNTELSINKVHGLGEIETANASGTRVTVDWNFANLEEFRTAVELYMKLEDELPAAREYNAKQSEGLDYHVEEDELFDFLVEGEAAANDLTAIAKKVLKDNEILTAKINKHSANMQSFSSSSTPGSAGRLHKLSLLASSDMNSFSKKIEDILPTFELTIERLSGAYLGFLKFVQADSEEGQRGLIHLRESMAALLDSSRAAKGGIHSFREATLGLGEKKLSKDLSRASRRQAEALNGLSSNIERVEAFSSKVLAMVERKLEQGDYGI